MKKIIFTLIFVLMVGLSFTSCTNHDLGFDPTENVTNAYNQAFVNTFGKPSSSKPIDEAEGSDLSSITVTPSTTTFSIWL